MQHYVGVYKVVYSGKYCRNSSGNDSGQFYLAHKGSGWSFQKCGEVAASNSKCTTWFTRNTNGECYCQRKGGREDDCTNRGNEASYSIGNTQQTLTTKAPATTTRKTQGVLDVFTWECSLLWFLFLSCCVCGYVVE